MRVRVLLGKRITLGVSGSIAAYKAIGIASALHQAGAVVDVAMTPEALKFLQPLSFQAITHRAVLSDLWSPGMETDIAHVTLGRESDVLVVAPATANTLAKLAHGIADDPVTVTALAAACPLIVAPAMDAGMYAHPATEANVRILRDRGAVVLDPEVGHLASGATGLGRLASAESILDQIRSTLGSQGDLATQILLITAGGTQEPIDPVRYISNRSSGKTGYALAAAARDRGARVILVSAPTGLRPPGGVTLVMVQRAEDMLRAVGQHYSSLSAIIMAAAVADYRVAEAAVQKVKRTEAELPLLLQPNPDILHTSAGWAAIGEHPVRVGFAAETQDLRAHALEKLRRKQLDLIVANDVSQPDRAFGADSNAVTLLWPDGREVDTPLLGKSEIADIILDAVVDLLAARQNPSRAASICELGATFPPVLPPESRSKPSA